MTMSSQQKLSSRYKGVRKRRAIGRPKGKVEDRNLKERILLAAAKLFGERGYEGASLKLIAGSVGITAPALYNHYKNKRILLYACLLHEIEEMVTQCEVALAESSSEDPRDQLYVFCLENAKFQMHKIKMQPLYNMVLYGRGAASRILTAGQRKKLHAVQKQHYNNLRKILDAGDVRRLFDIGDMATTAFSIFALAEHVNTWYRPNGPQTPDDIACSLAKLSMKMVGARPRSKLRPRA